MTNDIRSTVDRFVAAFNENDASGVPLAEDVEYRGPMLVEPIRGANAVRSHLEQVAPFVSRMTLKRLVAEGEWAAMIFEFEGLNGVIIEGAEFLRIRDGEIHEDLVYFDTRPLVAGPA
jgi:hypothetical protein